MKSIADLRRLERRVHRIHAGQMPAGSRAFNTSIRGLAAHAEIAGLDVDMSGDSQLQDLDPASATFGGFYYVPDYSIPGGDDILR
jgi:hypothetical protein